MCIEIKEGRYFDCIWYIQFNGMDMLGAVFKDEGGCWEMVYRFRYYKDDKAFGSADKKNWYEAKAPDGSDDALKRMINCVSIMLNEAESMGGTTHLLKVQTADTGVLSDTLMRQPWNHVGSPSMFDSRGVAAPEA